MYAEYDGGGAYAQSTTRRQQIEILPAPSMPTQLVLDALPDSAHVGDEIRFAGRLSSGGLPVQGALVEIKEDDPLLPDDTLASARTGADGRFSVSWSAERGIVETDLDVYAEYDGGGAFDKSQTQRQQLSVAKYGGDIRLDPIPRRAAAGDLVMFSGMLYLEMHDTEGAKVYIMDEDPLNPDDLLATAYVEADGRFAANWFANKMDADSEVDVYAVFEGSDRFYRQTTCDEGPTSSFGGLCSGTVQLEVRGASPGQPARGGGLGEEDAGAYMEMYYSMDIDEPPLVAIAPSPDNPGASMRYIAPVQEGIMTWTSSMERRYGGDWGVRFEVVGQGDPFFGERPDVVVNLVSHEEDAKCQVEYAGWARIYDSPPRPAPVQTIVCTAGPWGPVPGAEAGTTAAHEFIHAMGLGHAFNKAGDMMCSVEEGRSTCPSLEPKAAAPSGLNEAALASMYGADGFANPNNPVPYKSRLYDGELRGAARTDPDPGGTKRPAAAGAAEAEAGQPGPQGAGGGAVAIPEWIKASAGWWADGLVSDEEFARGIEYLVSTGIIG